MWLIFGHFSKFVFPRELAAGESAAEETEGEKDGRYELFSQMNAVIAEEIKELVLKGENNLKKTLLQGVFG